MKSNKIIECTDLFNKKQQEFFLESVYKKIDSTDIKTSIKLISQIDSSQLSLRAKRIYQTIHAKIQNKKVSLKIDSILDKAIYLSKQKDILQLYHRVKALKNEISKIWHQFSLSSINACLIKSALSILNKIVNKKQYVTKRTDLLNHIFNQVTLDYYSLQILEAASFIYSGQNNQGIEILKTIPPLILGPLSNALSEKSISKKLPQIVKKSFEIGRLDGFIPSTSEVFEILEESKNPA